MKITQTYFFTFVLLLNCLLAWMSSSMSHAGVFNLPHLISPGKFAIGIEPELNLSGGVALGANVRYTHGISEMSNWVGIIGTGAGTRQFRLGGAYTFDIFPDLESQPGIGLAVQGMFVQSVAAGVSTNIYEVSGIPYIHKSLNSYQGDFEPFLAIPIGISLASSGTYQSFITLALGSLFKHSEHLSSVIELGVGLMNSNTYISGGLTYYH